MQTKENLCQAIASRSVITFMYKGQPRIVEPFTLGRHKDTGNLVLRAFWIGGYSESQKTPHWRLYTVNKMYNIQITERPAAAHRIGYNSDDSHMITIYCAA